MGKPLLSVLAISAILPVLAGCGAGALGAAAALAGGGGGGGSGAAAGGSAAAEPSIPPLPPGEPPPSPGQPGEAVPIAAIAFETGAIEDLVRGPDGVVFYLSDIGKKQLLKLDVEQQTLTVLGVLDFSPGQLDASPDGKDLYVVDPAGSRVVRFDLSTKILTPISLPAPPGNVACDYERVYITTKSPSFTGSFPYTLEIYNPATGGRTTLSNWTDHEIVLDRQNRRLFVGPGLPVGGTVRSYSINFSGIPALLQETIVLTQGDYGIRLNPSGNALAVRGPNSIPVKRPGLSMYDVMPELTVKDLSDIPGSYDSGPQPFDIAYHPGGKEAVTSGASANANFLWVHATDTYQRLRKIDLSPWVGSDQAHRPLLEYSADGKFLVVATHEADSSGNGRVVVLDPSQGNPLQLPYGNNPPYPDTVSVGVVTDLVSSLDGSTMFATDFKYSRVVAIDAFTNQVQWTIPVGSRPVALDLDPTGQWLWVATRGATRLSKVDLGTKEVWSVRISGLPRDVVAGGDGLIYSNAIQPYAELLSRVNGVAEYEMDVMDHFYGERLAIDRVHNKLFTDNGTAIARYGLSNGVIGEQSVYLPIFGGIDVDVIAVSPKGTWVVAAPAPYVYDALDLTVRKGPLIGTIRLAAFSPDDTRLYTTDMLGSPTSVAVHDPATQYLLKSLPLGTTDSSHQKFAMGIAVTGSRIYVFSRGTSENPDGYLQWVNPY